MSCRAVHAVVCCAVLGAVLACGGCATITGTPTQSISIHTVDANDRPVDGMRCRVVNGSAEYFGTSPMYDLQVRRSSSDLAIECRRGALVARGTAVSRGSAAGAAVKALLPGGTASLLVDHVSGYGYAYPSALRLRVGQHLVFDASDDALGRPARGIQVDAGR
ncbi:MAG: hypothetical protein OHK0044_31650 [Burkholderiaceae bacterium]